jgi:hypothetical protein
MKKEKAIDIAKDFLKTMNPENWNGVGDKPESFNTLIKTYDISSDTVELDISFDYCKEDKQWLHYCELRNKQDSELIIPLHGYGVDSVQNLTDTIFDICQN